MVKYAFGYWIRKGKDTPSKTHIYFHEDDTTTLCGLDLDPVMGVRTDSDLCQQCIIRIHPFTQRQAVERRWRELLETESEDHG